LLRSNEESLDTIRLQCDNETGIYIDALRFTRLPEAAGKDLKAIRKPSLSLRSRKD
jgi:hypothetical protein